VERLQGSATPARCESEMEGKPMVRASHVTFQAPCAGGICVTRSRAIDQFVAPSGEMPWLLRVNL
jgi:hypothetical protein